MSKKHPPNDEWRVLALAAAQLHSRDPHAGEERFSQEDIAQKLNTSQSTVSRMLEYAGEQRWIEEKVVFHPDRCRQDLLGRSRALIKEDGLRSRLEVFSNHKLRRLIVIPAEDEAAFFTAAQGDLAPVLAGEGLVGCSWGRSVYQLCAAMEARKDSLPRGATRFFGLCAEPFGNFPTQEYSASLIAERLSKLFGRGDAVPPPSLSGVPTFVPLSFDDGEAEVIRRLNFLRAGYREVFAPGGLADRATCFLTSVGVPAPAYQGIFLKERQELGDLTAGEMADVLGDLGGVVVPGADASLEFADKVRRLNARWTGVTAAQVKALAARPSRGAGVIVVSWNENRLGLLHRLLAEETINTLVISQQLADGLRRLFAP